MDPNLAADDAMLARQVEAVRLWESPVPFVVLGNSGRFEEEVLTPCQIPVFRRSSGGGTVLQGPGCLNFSLVLSLDRSNLVAVETSYRIISTWVLSALRMPLAIAGSDILFNGRKISGSAQRRTRGWMLHHGTLLYNAFDLDSVPRVLREPARQPEHRNGRTHLDFLTKLPLTQEEVLALLVPRLEMEMELAAGCAGSGITWATDSSRN